MNTRNLSRRAALAGGASIVALAGEWERLDRLAGVPGCPEEQAGFYVERCLEIEKQLTAAPAATFAEAAAKMRVLDIYLADEPASYTEIDLLRSCARDLRQLVAQQAPVA